MSHFYKFRSGRCERASPWVILQLADWPVPGFQLEGASRVLQLDTYGFGT